MARVIPFPGVTVPEPTARVAALEAKLDELARRLSAARMRLRQRGLASPRRRRAWPPSRLRPACRATEGGGAARDEPGACEARDDRLAGTQISDGAGTGRSAGSQTERGRCRCIPAGSV
jgi:hypothetical protein